MITLIIRYTTLRVSLLLCCILFTFAPLGIAQAAPKTSSSNPQQSCSVLQVELHGSQPATSTCLQSGKTASTSGTVSPNTVVTGCSSHALELYSDPDYSGYTICFIGSGFVNMTDYCGPLPVGCLWNWNDAASSFWLGCSPVMFYTDTNGGGGSFYVGAYGKNNFPLGAINNDSLSSLRLYNNCS